MTTQHTNAATSPPAQSTQSSRSSQSSDKAQEAKQARTAARTAPADGAAGPSRAVREPTTASGPGQRPADGGSPPSAARHGRSVRRLVTLGLLITVFGAAAGFATAALLPPTYAARASVLYPLTQEQSTGFLREDRNLTTQLVLMESRLVLEPVATANQLTPEQLGNKVTATLVEGSEVIDLEVRDRDRDRGVHLADEVSKRYLQVANDTSNDPALAYIDKELAAIATQLPNADTAQTTALVQRQQALLSQRDALTVGAPRARIVVTPYSAPDPVGLRPGWAALTGGLAGLLVACAVVALLVRRQHRPPTV